MMIDPGRPSSRRRRGYGLIELTISSFVLIAAMSLMLTAATWVASERRGAGRRQVATQEAANLMERLAARPFAELTPETSRGLALSESAKAALPEGSLAVAIAEVGGDAPARRVSIEIRWRDKSGGRSAPVRLVAWVHRRRASS